MTNNEKFLDVLTNIFKRRGKETSRTKLFENESHISKKKLLDMANLEQNDLPVLVVNPRENYWLIISTRYTIVLNGSQLSRMPHEFLTKVNIDFGKNCASSPEDKRNANQLLLESQDGTEQLIELEPGKPLIGVWSILTHVATRYQDKH